MILCKYICECTLNGQATPKSGGVHSVHFTIIYYTVQKSVARVAWAVCVSSSGQPFPLRPFAKEQKIS